MFCRVCRTRVVLKTVLLNAVLWQNQIVEVLLLQTLQPLQATAALGSLIVQVPDLPIEHPEICVLFRVRLD